MDPKSESEPKAAPSDGKQPKDPNTAESSQPVMIPQPSHGNKGRASIDPLRATDRYRLVPPTIANYPSDEES